MKRKPKYIDPPLHKRLAQRILEGLVSTGAVYLLSPSLLSLLAPLQAQMNANAINRGQIPANTGAASVANKLIAVVPNPQTGDSNPQTGAQP